MIKTGKSTYLESLHTDSTATTKRKGRIALWFANEMTLREERVARYHVAMNVKAQPTI